MAEALAAAPDTVNAISAILAAETPEQEAPAQEAPEQPEQEVPAQENSVVEGEDPPEQATAEIPLDQLEAIQLEVEVSGEGGKVTEKPTIKELKLGYMRQKDYQAKTAEVARQREEIGEKTRQAIESELGTYNASLQQLHDLVISAVAPELRDVNWDHLSANDPTEWVRLRNRADQISQVLNGIRSKQQELSSQQKTVKSQATKAAAQKAVERLEREIPGWSDDLYKGLMNAGQDFGFKPEEVGSWVDPRAIRLLHDANEYRKLQSGKTTTEKRVVTPPKVIKPGAAPTQTQAQARSQEAMKRLQSSGRVDDAAAVIRGRM